MSEFGLSYKVDTNYSNELIEQVVSEDFRGKRREMWRNLVKLQEQGIREALIDLGWTPPPDQPEAGNG